METLKQLAVFVANRPGTLARISAMLAQHGINIQGLAVADAVDHAVLRFIVDKPARAMIVLGEAGLLVLETDIIALHLTNRPGEMSELGDRLSQAGVNIEYAYGGMGAGDASGVLFLKVSDDDLAKDVLSGMGL